MMLPKRWIITADLDKLNQVSEALIAHGFIVDQILNQIGCIIVSASDADGILEIPGVQSVEAEVMHYTCE